MLSNAAFGSNLLAVIELSAILEPSIGLLLVSSITEPVLSPIYNEYSLLILLKAMEFLLCLSVLFEFC